MKRMEMISIVNQILDCTDKMNFGSRAKTTSILGQLGYEFIDPMDVADIDFMVCEKAYERGYVLDKSHHDGEIMGLSQVYDFIKKKMDLVMEFEILDGMKCMTIADMTTDTAMATWQGEEVDKILNKMIKEFALDACSKEQKCNE